MEFIKNIYSIVSWYGYTIFSLVVLKFSNLFAIDGIDIVQGVSDIMQLLVITGGAISIIMTIIFNIKNWKTRRENSRLEKEIHIEELERLKYENAQHEKETINTVFKEKK